MRERPILFSGPMVRALLAGTKTQTRRVVNPQPPEHTVAVGNWQDPPGYDPAWWAFVRPGPVDRDHPFGGASIHSDPWRCPYGKPGDRLWVRETLKLWTQDPELFAYAADDTRVQGDGYNYPVRPGRPYVPSIHLARCWSRLVLEVTDVRVQRLQDISEADAEAEGVAEWAKGALSFDGQKILRPSQQYRYLWEQINGQDGPSSWRADPWVWAVSFKRVTEAQRTETGAASMEVLSVSNEPDEKTPVFPPPPSIEGSL